MKAELIIDQRIVLRPDIFQEVVIWRVPAKLPGSGHNYKYRLALIYEGRCVLRYDNEAGKGDHRHIGDKEEPYAFTSIEQLLADFDQSTEEYCHGNAHHR
jgi:hypothetical protein